MRALRIACNDSGNNSVNKSLTIHQQNLQLLMTDIFKTKNNLNPIFMKNIYATKNNYYSLRNHLPLSKVRATKYGTENNQLRGCSLWSSLPNSLKDSDSLQEFKRRINSGREVAAAADCAKILLRFLVLLYLTTA